MREMEFKMEREGLVEVLSLYLVLIKRLQHLAIVILSHL